MALAESPMAEGPITQRAAGLEIAADLRLPSGDHAGEEVLLARGLERRQLLLDLRADERGRSLTAATMAGLLKHIWGGNLVGSGPQSARRPVLGICFQSAVSMLSGLDSRSLRRSPRHRIVDVKGDGHVVFPGDRERIADELARLLVGHVEAEGPDGETQFVPGISRRPDRLDQLVDERLQLRLVSENWPGIGGGPAYP